MKEVVKFTKKTIASKAVLKTFVLKFLVTEEVFKPLKLSYFYVKFLKYEYNQLANRKRV